MDPFLGEIRMTGFNFAPTGWALCNGQQLSISQYQALFSLLGTYYGGNGTSNFNLPDLRGRVPLDQGQGTGLPNYNIGQSGGASSVTLNTGNLPAHTHLMNVSTNNADQPNPGGSILAVTNDGTGRGAKQYPTYTQTGATATLANNAIQSVGGNASFNIEPPYLCVNFIIALQGIYPSRN